jgi:hypothetical protein
VSYYDLRYTESLSLCTTCWSAFNAADVFDPPAPDTPGSPGSVDLTGAVEVGHTYKFQMISVDDHRASPPWTSGLSNVVTFHVVDCEDGLYAGGGDGGDGLLARPTAAASTDTDPHATVSAFHSGESSVLDGLAGGEARTERIVLCTPPKNLGEALRVSVRRGKSGTTILTGARLIAVDSPEGSEPVALPARVFAGQELPATRMLHQDRSDRTDQLGGDDNPYHGFKGDTLLISLPQAAGLAASTPLPLVVRASGPPPPTSGVNGGFLVQVSNGQGGWTTVERHVPHDQFTTFATDSVGGLFTRIVLLTSLDISSIGRLAPSEQSASSQARVASTLQHSRLGALEPTALDTSGVALAARDTLLLDFPADFSSPANGMTRSWVLELSGRDPNRPGANSAMSELAEPLPTRFALEQNRPNPFSTTTTFRFALPIASAVNVELYDLQGRHIHTVANGRYPAGWHTLTWDRGLSGSGRAQAGVYLCRMSAGSFRAVQKMIVYP